jgi:cytochrome c peroxidase
MTPFLWFVLLAIAMGEEARLPEPPLGLDLYMPVPENNPLVRGKVALGRRLFFDRRLSRDGTLACASCHDPARGFSDGRATARGLGGAEGRRSAPALLNRGYGAAQFWDGRAPTLERQVLDPITNPRELGLTLTLLEERTRLKAPEVAAALASYVRTIRTGGSRVDRYLAGERQALNARERSGLDLFRGKAGCVACHVGPNLTDEQFHNTGIAWRDGRFVDDGRFGVTGVPEDRGAFKTPTLRDIARTSPYMHDGSLATLEQVVEHYARGGRQNPQLDPALRRLDLSSEERSTLVAFLGALSGKIQEGWR